jgi:hypothetical protein
MLNFVIEIAQPNNLHITHLTLSTVELKFLIKSTHTHIHERTLRVFLIYGTSLSSYIIYSMRVNFS